MARVDATDHPAAGSHHPTTEYSATGGHETRDVSIRPIARAAVGLGVGVVLTVMLMQVLINYFASRESHLSAPASPLAGAYGLKAPPEPRLQTAPRDDLLALRAAEDATLHSYAWVDRESGVARIPIERAIDLLAERGLPARAESGGGAR
jgi:hypothetical protein